MKYFIFTWAKREKFVQSRVERTNLIEVRDLGDLSLNAEAATSIFKRTFGSLTHNDIIKIQECDAEGVFIGEEITPDENSAIIPVAK